LIDLNYKYEYIKELINDKAYYMSPGTSAHDRVSSRISFALGKYFDGIDSKCDVFTENINVFLNGTDSTDCVVLDVVVICDKSKYSERGYEGVPDLIVEILFLVIFIKNE